MECDLGNIKVFYEERGEGIPIILLHGYYLDHRMMMSCMEPIFKNRPGYRRIYPDMPGMGRTKGEAWIKNSDDMLEVLLDFIIRVIPGQDFLIAGESYGGYQARGILNKLQEQVKGLLLLCACIVPKHAERDLPPSVVLFEDKTLQEGLEPWQGEALGSAVVQSREMLERYQQDVFPVISLADESFLESVRNNGFAFGFEVDNLSKPFQPPVLILAGRQDSSVGYRDAWRILENFPRATFAVLDRAGHDLEIEQEILFTELVNEWLNRVEEYK